MAKSKKHQLTISGRGTALIYCRVSTKGQEEGTSLESQAEACIKHAESLGYTVGRVTNEIYSGASLWDRPLLSRDREDIKAGHFQAIVSYAIDRLSRNVSHLAILLDEAERYGVKIEFVTESLDDTPEGKLLLSARGYVAEVEREKIKERTLRGKRQILLRGRIHNHSSELYGYRRDKAKGVRVIHEPEAMVVRQIFNYAANEHLGVYAIAQRLTAQGIPSPAVSKGQGRGQDATRWGKHAVYLMLRNLAYKGETVVWTKRQSKKNGKWIHELRPEEERIKLPEGVTPAIVTPALWQSVQECLSRNRGENTRNQKRPYLLRGYIYCGVCRRRIYPSSTRGRRTYRCPSYEYSGSCGGVLVPGEDCEAWVWQQIEKLVNDPEMIAREIERIESQPPDPQIRLDLASAQNHLGKLEQGQQRLIRRLRDLEDEDLAAIIERELAQVAREKQLVSATMAELEARLSAQGERADSLQRLSAYVEQVAEQIAGFGFEEKRLALSAFGAEVIASGREWKLNVSIPNVDVADSSFRRDDQPR